MFIRICTTIIRRVVVEPRISKQQTFNFHASAVFLHRGGGGDGMAVCGAPATVKFERLPTFAKPIHYDVQLAPDLQQFKFDGKVSIDVEILEDTDVLKVHAQTLAINGASVKIESKVYDNLSTTYDEKLNILTVKLPAILKPQKVVLDFKFVGELNDKMRGFYRSCYKDASGNEKFLASTQFESTYARFAFPCWDEPVYKATFDVTLEVAPGLTALSNMNVVSTTPSSSGKTEIVKVRHEPQNELLSCRFCRWRARVHQYQDEKRHGDARLHSSRERRNKAASVWIFRPRPSTGTTNGAMENWGLVTYREVALLVDPAVTSTRQKSRVALVVAHELAHLWFGNLVTMRCTCFVGANCPEFKIWLHFVHDELASGMELDALRNSHPIEVEIDNPNELDEIYDSITYAKSNSVNRMLCYYLSEPVFQKGLRLYLKKFSYSNAVTQDLWSALSDASGQNVNELMSGWTKQMGFPVVKVSQKKEGDKRILTLEQRRFISDGGDDSANSLWQVPITVSVQSAPEDVKARFVLKERKQDFVVEGVADADWVKLNVGTTGFLPS
ncbi:unnamed protein product [Caenorhabditis auriculariae]|uniref:Puromycin-sensitive aminopeptidase n=1 Tax=Caenorhabditis auriculariae TaxID=2777116 RepID=A0A8S1HJC8_9PELO|nr:unnamed protein product [Caenorhabditis auriculariae]